MTTSAPTEAIAGGGHGVNGTASTEALVERLFESTIGALELLSVYLGWRLGLYVALATSGPMTVDELAAAAGIDGRYAQEWLEQQAVAGILDVARDDHTPGPRRFALPRAHAEALAVADDPNHVAPFGPMIVGIAAALPDVVDAYRSGGGVPYERYGADFREGQGAVNRPAFVHELRDWLAAAGEVHQRLSDDPPARVADIGCGQGHSSLAIARAYPKVLVDGIDLDEASIADAKKVSEEASVADRVTFSVHDAAALTESGPYDLVCIFEALHDMARPVDALRHARRALAPGGSVIVADERVADTFTAPGDSVERMMYGWSVLHCLPASRVAEPSAALGTVLRTSTMERLADDAGFSRLDVLPIDNDFFRFYRLIP